VDDECVSSRGRIPTARRVAAECAVPGSRIETANRVVGERVKTEGSVGAESAGGNEWPACLAHTGDADSAGSMDLPVLNVQLVAGSRRPYANIAVTPDIKIIVKSRRPVHSQQCSSETRPSGGLHGEHV